MRDTFYKLDGHKAVRCANEIEWAHFFQSTNRQVAHDKIRRATVSTVFIGINVRYGEDGPPLVFETAIFNGRLDNYVTRASTWEQALIQHAVACDLVRYGSRLRPVVKRRRKA